MMVLWLIAAARACSVYELGPYILPGNGATVPVGAVVHVLSSWAPGGDWVNGWQAQSKLTDIGLFDDRGARIPTVVQRVGGRGVEVRPVSPLTAGRSYQVVVWESLGRHAERPGRRGSEEVSAVRVHAVDQPQAALVAPVPNGEASFGGEGSSTCGGASSWGRFPMIAPPGGVVYGVWAGHSGAADLDRAPDQWQQDDHGSLGLWWGVGLGAAEGDVYYRAGEIITVRAMDAGGNWSPPVELVVPGDVDNGPHTFTLP